MQRKEENVTIGNFLKVLFEKGHRTVVHPIVNNNSIVIIIKTVI